MQIIIDTYFHKTRSEISTPSNNSHTGEFGEGVKIAAVMPTFTAAAYDNAFYVFYRKYINVAYGVNITTDLNLLTSKVTNEPSDSASGFSMVYLLGNLKWTQPGSDITFLTDQDVDAGAYLEEMAVMHLMLLFSVIKNTLPKKNMITLSNLLEMEAQ